MAHCRQDVTSGCTGESSDLYYEDTPKLLGHIADTNIGSTKDLYTKRTAGRGRNVDVRSRRKGVLPRQSLAHSLGFTCVVDICTALIAHVERTSDLHICRPRRGGTSADLAAFGAVWGAVLWMSWPEIHT